MSTEVNLFQEEGLWKIECIIKTQSYKCFTVDEALEELYKLIKTLLPTQQCDCMDHKTIMEYTNKYIEDHWAKFKC